MSYTCNCSARDDLNVLEFIQAQLQIGNVRLLDTKCVFTVTNALGTLKLISIFEKYNLNSSKHLDYLNYKESFALYQDRNKELLKSDLVEAENFANQILEPIKE